MTQGELSFEGRFRRDQGMRRVTARTDAVWSLEFESAANHWFNRLRPGTRFAGETIRLAATTVGIREPHTPNAWSAAIRSVVASWLRDGRLEVAGATTCIDPRAHARLTRLYVKTEPRV